MKPGDTGFFANIFQRNIVSEMGIHEMLCQDHLFDQVHV